MGTYPQIHPARTMALAVVSPSPNNGGEVALVNACAEILIIRFRATHLNTGHLMKAWSAWGNPSYC